MVMMAVLAVAGCTSAAPPSQTDLSGEGCLVLAYHRVVPRSVVTFVLNGSDDFMIYEEDFRDQIRSLKTHGATFIKAEDLEKILKKRMPPPHNCVLVTLDDADITQYQYVFPILKAEQIPFTLFVITGQVGSPSFHGMEMSTWAQIKEMVDSGLATVGSHTHNMHEPGSTGQPVFADHSYAKPFDEDLQESIGTIERELGAPPHYFAYPFGFGTPQTDETTLRHGMRLIFSLREGLVRPGDPSFFVKRVMITPRKPNLVKDWIAERDLRPSLLDTAGRRG
jgi:peptidoglycan/xylan/chitin deacetylase (PgdA/CDA1 family)